MASEYAKYHRYRGNNLHTVNVSLADYIMEVLPENKETRILDIGCGIGDALCALKKLGYKNIQGIDMDEEAVQIVNKKGIACVHQDVLQFRPNEKFELVMLNHVLEHLPKKNVIPLLRYIHDELLADKGQMIIRVPNGQSCTGSYWAYEDFTHETLYTAGSLQYVLKCAGFRKVDFLDKDGLANSKGIEKIIRKSMLCIYEKKLDFQNYILGGAFHKPSPRVYTWELKVLAKK